VSSSHRQRRENKERAWGIGPLRLALIVDPLPDSLLEDVMRTWPEGALSRNKVLMHIRHRVSNYDALIHTLRHQRYDELRRVADDKVALAFDAWLDIHPEAPQWLRK
jgi:hypothetical protein